MQWTRSETLALAAPKCALCQGVGLLVGRRNKPIPCNCVLRAIFRACYTRFIDCAEYTGHINSSRLEYRGGGKGRGGWGMKEEEYMADFCLITRRTLDAADYRIFRYHYLLGADWHLCCRKLGMEKGDFFHAAYRIEQKLGRVFRELKPYSLYPVDEYFGVKLSQAETADLGARVVRFVPVRPTLARRPPIREEHDGRRDLLDAEAC